MKQLRFTCQTSKRNNQIKSCKFEQRLRCVISMTAERDSLYTNAYSLRR